MTLRKSPSGRRIPVALGAQGYRSAVPVAHPISAPSVFVPVTGPFVVDADTTEDLLAPAAGVWRYVGPSPASVALRVSVAVSKPAGVIVTSILRFALDGAGLVETEMPVQTIAGIPLNVATFKTVSLVRGSEVSLEIANETNADDLQISAVRFGVVGNAAS